MDKIRSEWKKVIILSAGVLASALLLRFLRVVLYNQPVFGDEAIYIRWAQVAKAEPSLRFISLSDGKQPLFIWSIIPFLKLFGDPLIAGRLVSVFSGVMSLTGVIILSYILFNSLNISLFAGLIYAVMPFAVFFDSMALADALLSMFGIWTLIFGLLSVKYKRLDYAMLAGFALGGALLTKSPGLYFALLLPSALVFLEHSKKGVRIKDLIQASGLLAVSYLLAYFMYNIQRLGPNFHMLTLRNNDYVYPVFHLLERPFDPLLPFLNRSFEYFWIWGPSVFIFFIIFGVILNFTKFKKETLLLCFWSFVPLVISAEYAKVFTARYILYIIPTLTILGASVLTSAAYKKIFKTLAIILVVHALWIDFLLLTNIQKAPMPTSERTGYLEEWTSGYGIKEVAMDIRNQYLQNPNQQIVVGTEGYFGTLPDGLQIYLNDLPKIIVLGVGINLSALPKSLVESKKAGNKTFLVINNSRLSADYNDLNLNLLATYPKAFRTTGTSDYNLKGPQEVLYLFEVGDVN
ncbi:hypothetical protein A3A76_03920 [Candidatus Woesebacteria bacterium RIFCSPLOWO2_01_FULL_39_23]|uniref:Glycosyltransferase RgtA/B/C/D-like domain-containing protein n=1 Tax=Candidatus Woesebacteria bacterium RIFCSPHIGHO2_01_FULL_40_22 TaxID=1802499 RepID=A0A1F7YJS6_9BACT|nr:MAG: hypothetical protein A2141_00090 [Candidatus Woesebacteria bacterium RBG_16_40_11]OGM27601.1 MAG: hypothetical protein A2628_02320 [Candidatus Woesebacteria bacterium RIFCSPHIGHO2_01_FULL_40_22]OGM36754.1 MAG: hypothetical protein A3E41_03170 [Candidatus Woesebacteria bacterium RIFCSPHIGHO2_12_FULL_38_9]OGM62775.1 MAG: hypothetical protein A3A76_03920 [Candidatus Woesebacteria bacterium RIFCSPLOWO2_01_FULL_39_23]